VEHVLSAKSTLLNFAYFDWLLLAVQNGATTEKIPTMMRHAISVTCLYD